MPQKPKWSQFLSLLQAEFEPLPPSFTARTELKQLKQTGSLSDYINSFRLLSGRINDMAEADRVDKFIDGLKPAIAQKVSAALPDDLIKATTIAIKLDAAYQQAMMVPGRQQRVFGRNRPHIQPHVQDSGHRAPMQLGQLEDTGEPDQHDDDDAKNTSSDSIAAIYPSQSAIPKLTEAVRAELMASGKCFRCRQKGHLARNCTFFDQSKKE